MTAVPATRVWVAGEVVIDSYMNNNLSAVLNFLLARPMCKARQTVAQTLATGANSPLTLDVEDYDNTGMHSTVTNTSRVTAVYPGWYSAGAGGSFVNNVTGLRLVRLQVNGTTLNDSDVLVTPYNGNTTRMSVRGGVLFFLNVGDYVEVAATQTSGGNLATPVSAGEQAGLNVVWQSN